MVGQSVFLQNPKALLCWMVAGSELERVCGEFEDNCLDGGAGKTTRTNLKHHEHTASAQVKFATEVGALVQVLEDNYGKSIHGRE